MEKLKKPRVNISKAENRANLAPADARFACFSFSG
jgi:hypothetical protein